jgi:SAM-dependent methyltransferase
VVGASGVISSRGSVVAEQPKQEGEPVLPRSGDLRPFSTLAHENTAVEFEKKVQMIEAKARLRLLRPEAVVDYLGVGPGMSALEIGAGTGLFSFALAEAVGPQGQAFGTEISAPDFQWLRAEGKRRGLAQFEAVRVGPSATDPFYAAHQFDIVLLSSVLEYIPDPVDYFRTLRPSLTPKTGRVVLIQGRFGRYFLPEDFTFGFKASDLLALGDKHPVRTLVAPRLLRKLAAQGGRSVNDLRLREELAGTFNRMLAEPDLFRAILSMDRAEGNDPDLILRATLLPDELELWRWLYGSGIESLGLPGGGDDLDLRSEKTLSELNFLSLLRWFNRGEMSRRFTSLWAFYLSDSSIIERMRQAGYVPVDEGRSASGEDFLFHHSFLVFEVSPPD